MDHKGQISVEFLLLTLIILIILSTVTIPLISNSISDGMDVSKVSDSKSTVQTIANGVNIVGADGFDAKRTIDVYVPNDNTALTADIINKNIYITVTLSDSTTKKVIASIDYNNVYIALNATKLSKGWQKVQVQWLNNGTIQIST